MPSARRQKAPPRRPGKSPVPHPKPGAKGATKPAVKAPAKPSKPARPAKGTARPSGSSSAASSTPTLEVPLPGGRRHVLSLSFVRDGDEFMARLETDAGHITELKNRSLDQLLTLVASELEDLLE